MIALQKRRLLIAGREILPDFGQWPPSRLERLGGFDHGPNVAVFENEGSGLPRSVDDSLHHGASQIIRPDHLVWKQHAKRGVDRAQHAVAEVRFFARLHGIDVGRPEDVDSGNPAASNPFSASPL